MILVQGIGMSGYLPLEGLVSLSHFLLDRDLGGCCCRFDYLYNTESRFCDNPSVLGGVVSFATFSRFDDYDRSFIIRHVGLLSGYHRAGAVLPRRLFSLIVHGMRLRNYHGWTYILPTSDVGLGYFLYTTAWSEYVCVDFGSFRGIEPCFLVQMLGRFEVPLPTFRCDELRYILG